MADSNGITLEVITAVDELTKRAAQIALKRLSGEYGLNVDDLILSFDSGNFVWKAKRLDASGKVEIICGQDMRPSNPKEFGKLLRQVLQFVNDQKLVGCKSIESVNTIKARNDKYQEMYKNMRRSKLIPESRLSYRKYTSILVVDDETKESVMVTGEAVDIWSLQREAHILLSRKVLGE